jgi:hypothetical protein
MPHFELSWLSFDKSPMAAIGDNGCVIRFRGCDNFAALPHGPIAGEVAFRRLYV